MDAWHSLKKKTFERDGDALLLSSAHDAARGVREGGGRVAANHRHRHGGYQTPQEGEVLHGQSALGLSLQDSLFSFTNCANQQPSISPEYCIFWRR